MTVDTGWRTRAACSSDPDRQFPDYNAGRIAAAKRVCAGCPVRAACLREALLLGDREGVWGGFTYAERRNLQLHGRAVRHMPRTADCPTCGREVPMQVKGLRRHNRLDTEKGWSYCPGSGKTP